MMWPTLQALQNLGNSGTIQEINELAIRLMQFSDAQQNMLHGDGPQTEVAYRMAWARTYLKAVGALENSNRGVWSLTEAGASLRESDMSAVVTQVRARSSRKKTPVKRNDSKSESQERVEVPIPTDDDSLTGNSTGVWREQLLAVLQDMQPASFEKLCQRILRESGFTSVDVTGRSGDGGIDGVGVLRIALLSFQVFFQCKRYRGSVGSSAIRDFRGAMVGRTDKGLLITTGSFTSDAKREAARDGAPVLDLIDGDALCTLLKELKLGVATRLVEETTIDVNWLNSI
jgi:restriction system protein